jgi:predicted DNA-binding mobile mystery protein A
MKHICVTIGLKDNDMSPDQTLLARKNLDRRLSKLNREAVIVPPFGWVRAIREALGLSPQKLADRMGVTRPRVNTLEKAEVTGSTTIKTLREAAEAMNCTFVYAIVPSTTLDDILREQAAKKADIELARYHHTMRLENQAMDKRDLATERERLVSEMLMGSLRRVWDDE